MIFKGFLTASILAASTVAAVAESPVTYFGDIGLAVGRDRIMSTDDDDEGISINSGLLDGYVGAEMNGWRGTLDFSMMRRGDNNESNFDSFAPTQGAALGLHFGRNLPNNGYVGLFLGRNWFQGDDAATNDSNLHGSLYGIEGEFQVMPRGMLYGQVGRARMIGDGTTYIDTGFEGNFAKLGMAYQYNDRLLVRLEGERGKSPFFFEDNGDWGDYNKISLGGEYELRPNLLATAKISHMNIRANTEDDGNDNTIQLGLRWRFGAQSDSYNLRTTYMPGQAAAWGEVLD